MKHIKYFENLRLDRTVVRFRKAMKPMNIEETVDYVIENCSEWLDNPTKITRSIDAYDVAFYSEPVTRFSKDNKNFYTLLIDHLPSWKDYPKRKKSFMATLGNTHIGGDNTYVMIPLNGAKIAVAPEYDIFTCFKRTHTHGFNFGIDTFFDKIDELCKVFDIFLSDSNFTVFKKQIKELQKEISILSNSRLSKILDEHFYIDDFIYQHLQKGSIWKAFVDIIEPKINDFRLLTIQEIYKNLDDIRGDNKEIWTDSPCIFVNVVDVESFLDLIEEKMEKEIIVK